MSKSKTSILLLVVLSIAFAGSRAVSGSNELPQPTTKRSYNRSAVDLALNKTFSRARGLRTLSLNVGRRGHTATALADGRVLIAGGENQNGPVGEVEAIDPRSSRVDVVATLGTARGGHTATVLQDGRVIIIGGSRGYSELRSTEIFDPATGSISSGPRLIHARSGHSATLLRDGQVLVAGGSKRASAEIFDPNTGKITLLAGQMLEARHHHGAELLSNGTVLLAGGLGRDGKALDTAEVFNPVTSQFEAIVGWMGARRISPRINQLPDGKVQIIGGDEAGTMEMYSPEGRFFRSKASLTLTAEMLPAEALLLARTRSAYLDGLYSSARQSKVKKGFAAQSTNQTPLDLQGYSATETAGGDFAVIAGGIDANGRVVGSVLVTENTTDALITTDRIDYRQQESPVITGSGWAPGETILVVRQQSTAPFGRTLLRSSADASGNFSNSELIPADHQIGSYILTAIGEKSGFVAQTTYRTAPVLNPRVHYPDQPRKITFQIPLNGKAGSTETEVGTLRWKPKGGEGAIAPQSFGDTGTGSIPACLTLHAGPVDIDLCASDVQVEVLNSHFEVNISAEGVFTFDPGDIGTGRLASFELGFEITESFDAALKFRITGAGSLGASAVVLPFFPPIGFGIEDILEGELKAGLKVGVEASIEPTTFEVEFNASQSHTIGANVSTATGFGGISRSNREPQLSGGVTVIDVGQACLKVFLGPAVDVSLTVGPVGGSLGAIVDGFVEGCIDPTLNSTCNKYEVSINAGVEASISGAIDFFEASFGGVLNFDIFDVNIFSLTHVESDTAAPVFTSGVGNLQMTTEAGKCSAKVSYTAQAEDACSGLQTITCQPPSDSTFPKGVTTIACTATDRSGNSANASFSVTVKDAEMPVLAATPSVSRSTDPGLCSALVNYSLPLATDNCPGVTVNCQPPSGTTFAKGATTVNCTATDTSLNSATSGFTVTVSDTEKPRVNEQTVLALAAPGTFSTMVNLNARATDNCPGLQVVLQPPSGSLFPAGSTLVTGTATDAAGNVSLFSFTVKVFNIIAVDDSTGGILRAIWNGGPAAQYEYFDCRKGFNIPGTMSITTNGCKVEGRDLGPDPKRPDRNVYILFNKCTFHASGWAEFGTAKNNFSDADVRNSPLTCP